MLRELSRIEHTPPPAPGFIGEGHTAVEVLSPDNLSASDPFVLLMDDRMDMPTRRHIGGAHPHAGLETVTFVLEGELWDRDEGAFHPGDVMWMTAGRGIIHNESVEVEGRSRVLQLWIGLPEKSRNAAPRFELVRKADALVHREAGVEARLYSGQLGALVSKTQNHVPVTLVDIALQPGASFAQDLPTSYNGFFYVIEGTATVAQQPLEKGQVGWLRHASASGVSTLQMQAGPTGARLVLYAGEPHGEPLLQHGPFVAGSREELMRCFAGYQAGKFVKMSELAKHG